MLISNLRILLCIAFSAFYACKTTSSLMAQKVALDVTPSATPINLENIEARFYKDVRYGQFKDNVFDIFIPASTEPVPLVLYIHGGGFIDGDKAKLYTPGADSEKIKWFLSNNVAFASINYRLLSAEGNEGVITSLNDSKRALQFIRFYANTFNIDKDKIVLMGASAGAGTSLWIGLNNDMADKSNSDPILKESTRVSGIVAIETQADYDILEWHNNVFKDYQSQGLDLQYIRKVGTDEKLLRFFGLKDVLEFNSDETREYREKLSMLKMMSKDDPEIYAVNAKLPNTMPKRTGELNHHPLHVKALMDRAHKVGLKGSFYIPKMNIDTRGGESKDEFVLRVLGK